MALYSSKKYGATKYGNANYIVTITGAFQAAQAELVRAPSSAVIINSHYKQYGDIVNHPSTVYVGGAGRLRASQCFISPTSFTCASIQVMLKGTSTNTDTITAEIQTDASGSPSGTVVANATSTISAVISSTQQWQKFVFDGTVSLVAGTTYWICLKTSGTDRFYVAADDAGLNDPKSSWADTTGVYASFKYGDGTHYGSDLWTSQNYILLTRLVSSAEASNDQVIDQAVGWKVLRNKLLAAQELTAQVINQDYRFSVGQSYNDYASQPKKIKCYLGFDVAGVGTVYFLVFIGETEASPVSGDIFELRAQDYMKKLLNDYMTSEGLGGTAFEDIIESVARHAGITNFDLRTTGKTSLAGISFQNLQAYGIAEKVRQATIDQMSFFNTTTLKTAARVRPNVTEATVPDYVLTDATFIKDCTLIYDTDKMINRITITNDENGETSSDGATLNVGNYATIGTAAGSLADHEQTKDITITFTEYACIYTQVSDAETDCEILAVDVTCGTSAAYGNMVVTLRNKKYPLVAGDYSLTAKGCPISNADTNTHLAESMHWSSIQNYGLFSDRIDNRIFASAADAEAMADAVINERSMPIPKIKANCRGIVDIWPDDVCRFTENRKTKLNHLGIINMVELNYSNEPRSFVMYVEAEKLDLVGA